MAWTLTPRTAALIRESFQTRSTRAHTLAHVCTYSCTQIHAYRLSQTPFLRFSTKPPKQPCVKVTVFRHFFWLDFVTCTRKLILQILLSGTVAYRGQSWQLGDSTAPLWCAVCNVVMVDSATVATRENDPKFAPKCAVRAGWPLPLTSF